MIQINLLPHREIKRRLRQRMFVVGTTTAAVVGVLVVILGHLILQKQLDNQQARNQFLTTEIASLDAKIAQIKQIKEETEALLARKNVVETLQSNRTETVHLLDEVARQMPDGVYLKAMRQSGTKITLEGYAQSNARISTLMENLDRSPWLDEAELLESRQVTLNNERLHEFSLDVQLKYNAEEDKQRQEQEQKQKQPVSPVAVPSVMPQPTPAKGATTSSPDSKSNGSANHANVPASTVPPGGNVSTTGNIPNHEGVSNSGAKRVPVLGLPTPESVRSQVNHSIAVGRNRSMP